ncbi:MAG TPA: hypothetical protein VJ775_02895 [Sphingomicrobium sp.]|nr:hypothetical protein [Sphingomicrobium sp.]
MIRNVADLRDQAKWCRRLAKDQSTETSAKSLKDMARQYDELADEIEADAEGQSPIGRPLGDR